MGLLSRLNGSHQMNIKHPLSIARHISVKSSLSGHHNEYHLIVPSAAAWANDQIYFYPCQADDHTCTAIFWEMQQSFNKQPSHTNAYTALHGLFFYVCHPEVFNTYINIQWCVSQTQQNFYYVYYCTRATIINIIKVLLCLTYTSLYIYILHEPLSCVKEDVWL